MSEFLKMDVFFVVTTVAVVLLTILGGLVLWRLIRILKNLEHVSEQIARESDVIRSDLASIRSVLHERQWGLQTLFGWLRPHAKKQSKKTSPAST